ncbi:hypothetical protein RF55_13137 [Lasius niger]|uniref:Uncharacterized protein n=1 Tax=Lasius niger TaxID=67767 RepID=A0A0J7KAW5_LASNI|nr:hypothetical protein RF55_13137 [Lasius niger]
MMRKFADACDASIPTSLRGTMLRKHIATYTAMLLVEENQVSDLANFMGHNKQIHKDVYRISNGLFDMTEVSRLLQAAIGDNDENEDSNEENGQTKDDTKDDNVQTKSASSDDDFCKNDSNNFNISDDEPQSQPSRRRIRTRQLNYDDEILNSSTHCSSSASRNCSDGYMQFPLDIIQIQSLGGLGKEFVGTPKLE